MPALVKNVDLKATHLLQEDFAEVPEEWKISNPVEQKHYLVDGELRAWGGAREPVRSTLSENREQSYIGSYPWLSGKEALEILDSAVRSYDKGFGVWAQKTPQQRIEVVEAFIEDFKLSRNEVVKLLVWEIGKTSADAYKEFDRTVQYLENTLSFLSKNANSEIPAQGLSVLSERQALGVVLCLGPFNYPLNETLTTVIPALLMGNSVIMKPAKLGVLLYEPIQKLFQKHFPKGTINFVYGDGREVVSPLMQSGKIDSLVFIGSTQVADILVKQHPHPHRLKMVLGLGAKNPAIVTGSANLFETIDKVIKGALSFNGQRCTALKSIFVHKSIYQSFSKLLAFKVDQLKAGLPWEEGVSITALAESGKDRFFDALVDDAVSKGAKILNSKGGITDGNIYFPVVLGDVDSSMRIYAEEQFGPVLPIIPYDDYQEVLSSMANSDFGQQASIFSSDTDEIKKLTHGLRRLTTRININQPCERGPDHLPFAARKGSGQGVISIEDALKEFSVESLVVKAA